MSWQSEYKYGFRFLRSQEFPGLVIREYYVGERVKAGWGNPTHMKQLRLWMVYAEPGNNQVDAAFKRVAQSGRYDLPVEYRDAKVTHPKGEDGFLRLGDAKAAVIEYVATLAVVQFLQSFMVG